MAEQHRAHTMNFYEFSLLSSAYDKVSAASQILTSFKAKLGELRFGIVFAWVQSLMHLNRAHIPPSAWVYWDFVSSEMARTLEATPDGLKFIDTITTEEITGCETAYWNLHLALSESVITRCTSLLETEPPAQSQEWALIDTVLKDPIFWDVAEHASHIPIGPCRDDCALPVDLQMRVIADERNRHLRCEWNLRRLTEWQPQGRPQ